MNRTTDPAPQASERPGPNSKPNRSSNACSRVAMRASRPRSEPPRPTQWPSPPP